MVCVCHSNDSHSSLPAPIGVLHMKQYFHQHVVSFSEMHIWNHGHYSSMQSSQLFFPFSFEYPSHSPLRSLRLFTTRLILTPPYMHIASFLPAALPLMLKNLISRSSSSSHSSAAMWSLSTANGFILRFLSPLAISPILYCEVYMS